MTKIITKFMIARHFARNDSGATAIEYGLIAGLIAVVIITAITLVGTNLTGMFGKITTGLGGTPG